ncbi:MAG: MarR family winged helix-turn-helix transcriptional regulator [Jatrophihabitantaceae bacterium]
MGAVALDPGDSADDRHGAVVEVADDFVGLIRSFQRARARFVAAAEHDLEWSAHLVLRLLAAEGPMRAGAIAGWLRSDPSTVSRQVATMVKDGLLERRSDPEDGRASILALTPKADEVITEHERIRIAHFVSMLSDWDEPDLTRFAQLLRRFTTDFEISSAALATEPAAATEGSN